MALLCALGMFFLILASGVGPSSMTSANDGDGVIVAEARALMQ